MKPTEYIDSDRRGRAAHDIELEAMRDDFLAEALEGFEAVSGDHAASVGQLRKRIAAWAARPRQRLWPRLTVAAALLTIVTTTALLILRQPQVPNNPAVAVATPPPTPLSVSHPTAPQPAQTSAEALPHPAYPQAKAPEQTQSEPARATPIAQSAVPDATAPVASARATTATGRSTEHSDLPEYAAEREWTPKKSDELTIDEVVVVAYGTANKNTYTGAVGSEIDASADKTEQESEDGTGIHIRGEASPRQETTTTLPETNDQPFTQAETMPQFRGGDLAAFRKWVDERIRKPEIALNNGIQGHGAVSFVIDTLGNLSGIQALQSPDQTLTQEIIRVLKTSPRWEPGRQGGRKVPVKYVMPIDFRRQN